MRKFSFIALALFAGIAAVAADDHFTYDITSICYNDARDNLKKTLNIFDKRFQFIRSMSITSDEKSGILWSTGDARCSGFLDGREYEATASEGSLRNARKACIQDLLEQAKLDDASVKDDLIDSDFMSQNCDVEITRVFYSLRGAFEVLYEAFGTTGENSFSSGRSWLRKFVDWRDILRYASSSGLSGYVRKDVAQSIMGKSPFIKLFDWADSPVYVYLIFLERTTEGLDREDDMKLAPSEDPPELSAFIIRRAPDLAKEMAPLMQHLHGRDMDVGAQPGEVDDKDKSMSEKSWGKFVNWMSDISGSVSSVRNFNDLKSKQLTAGERAILASKLLFGMIPGSKYVSKAGDYVFGDRFRNYALKSMPAEISPFTLNEDNRFLPLYEAILKEKGSYMRSIFSYATELGKYTYSKHFRGGREVWVSTEKMGKDIKEGGVNILTE